MPFFITAITSYLLGSIPFGYVLVRVFRGQDVRETGSGNIGATNVARTSPALGAATLVLDALKGSAAAALARHLHPEAATLFMATAALFAIVGHMFPVWLRWRGGKGVATALGSFLCVAPKSVLVMVGIFVVVVAASRYISLGSIVAAVCFPFLVLRMEHTGTDSTLLIAAACALIIIRHHENIGRLLRGSESKFSVTRTPR
jgi:glycerol-3-phosphate acyltransferase PlsY